MLKLVLLASYLFDTARVMPQVPEEVIHFRAFGAPLDAIPPALTQAMASTETNDGTRQRRSMVQLPSRHGLR